MIKYRVTDADGRQVVPGDSVTDFRGGAWIFEDVIRGPMPGKSAKVKVSKQDTVRVFYANVFDLTVEKLS